MTRAAGAAAIVLALFAASAATASAAPSPFRHDLHRIDGRLRMAIEYGPAELGEGLTASETLCRLAEKTEARGEDGQAAEDWSALTHLVGEVDRPTASRIDDAFRRADAGLLALRERYTRAWPDPARIRALRRGVAQSRIGIKMMRAAMAGLAPSFEAWEARNCRGATEAIEAVVARLPAGLNRINRGMQRLWALALPAASRVPGR